MFVYLYYYYVNYSDTNIIQIPIQNTFVSIFFKYFFYKQTKYLIMYDLTKKEKLNFVLEKIQELGLSAYEISNNTKMTEAGVARIIKGVAKSPHESSLNELISFLLNRTTGSNLDNNSHLINEQKENNEMFKLEREGFTNCLQEVNKLTKAVITLQGLLRKNNIAFNDYFEE